MIQNQCFRNLICGASFVLSLHVTLSMKCQGQSERVPLCWCVPSLWTSQTPSYKDKAFHLEKQTNKNSVFQLTHLAIMNSKEASNIRIYK